MATPVPPTSHISIFCRGGLTLEEALQLAYSEDHDVRNIFIEPPDATELTDEDSGDEDGGGMVDNLSRNQLSAVAQMEIFYNDATEEVNNNPEEDNDFLNRTDNVHSEFDNTEQGLATTTNFSVPVEKVDYNKIQWINGDLEDHDQDFPSANYEKFKTMTALEIFELFIDDEIIEYMILESTKYAQYNNWTNSCITKEEMRCFLAILILSGYNGVPGKKYFWNTQGDLGNKLVADAMRRDRFLTIWRHFHLADNTQIDITDKYYKLRPLMQKLQKKFVDFYVPEKYINYDESMVKYFGRHSCKQFIKGKPIRFGYKLWCLNTKSGYLINFVPYQGKDRKLSHKYQEIFGSAAAPFVMLMQELPDEKSNLRYSLYCDNLFTSFHLLHFFKQLGYSLTGTIRDNRIPNNCPLVSKKVMSKKTRGEVASILDKENGIILVRWVDNSVVTMASTSDGVFPKGVVKRYSRVEKRNIQVPRPCLIGKYNNSMGGTDLMDENISRYRIAFRSKKWWWCLFTWLIDATIQNAWILHKKSGNYLTQLQFKREIVLNYLNKYRNRAKTAGRPSTSASSRSFCRVSDDIRYDNFGHYLIPVHDNKKIRCAGEDCKSIMRTMCFKCKVGLCIKCNLKFHNSL